MQLTDTHCHLQFEQFTDRSEIIKAAANAHVNRLICIGTTLKDSQAAANIAADFKNVWASAGTHPHDAEKYNGSRDSTDILYDLLRQPKVVAVGEVGLDFYKNYSGKQDQIRALRSQIETSIDLKLPYIFHVREAWKDFWPIVDEYKIKNGVIHSFSTNQTQLDEALARNLYVSLNGIMTFTHDKNQLAAARQIPLDKLLLETDAPFLTPSPHRGKLCEPKYIADIAKFLAELRNETIEELSKKTTTNASILFNLN